MLGVVSESSNDKTHMALAEGGSHTVLVPEFWRHLGRCRRFEATLGAAQGTATVGVIACQKCATDAAPAVTGRLGHAAVVAPPPELDAADLVAAVDHAAETVGFTTDPHPVNRDGWHIGWGDQVLTKVITVAAEGQVTDAQVAAYLAKYATKSTEVTGHASNRLTNDTVTLYADPDGTHTERLIDACWRLGSFRISPESPGSLPANHRAQPAPVEPFGALRTDPDCGGCTRYRVCPTCAAEQVAAADEVRRAPAGPPASPYLKLRRWAHMLGFGGHFLTKSRRYSITFAMLRDQRVAFRRAQTGGPERAEPVAEPTTLVLNFLAFVGAGWQTAADAMLANTSAAMAREHQAAARDALDSLAA
jgi:hypothetical protein